MNGNGQTPTGDAQVLCWPRRVLSADDLRRHLTSQRELQLLPRTIVTPLAADELKARGVRITCQTPKPTAEKPDGRWGYAQERPDAAVEAAVRALDRNGASIVALELPAVATSQWAQAVVEIVVRAQCLGAIAFCGDPALVSCVANKLSGVRAAAVASAGQAARARQCLGANLFAVEMPGRTFFEVRQILHTICGNSAALCPPELAQVLKELDGHAHR